MTTWAPAVLKKVLWKRKISRCGFCPFFTFEIIQYMLSANLVLWILSSLCSDKDCHTWQHEMMARWEQLEEPFHPNFSNWSFAFLDFYKVWKWHILLLCTNFDNTDEIKCNLFESFKGNLFLDFVTGGIPHICHGRHGRRPCKFFLAGVNFYRFNAKNWRFSV